ncbi:DUF2799 domain-containing protein [Vibrio sp. 404]|uniref:DUF2799 domain-containing protein n=1 Tax=Vibrio marinisediminis TaxID=2758441 RepID=A0A7W2FUM7_9VIBR|nr:DUF2799 domain-containing protein [Vibrio marinisediminis]MBA5764546.1 DUF2799 domain-containing protein [Vibrio marinisediminis]
MKWKTLLFGLVLVGCSSQITATLSDDVASWQRYGEQRASDGHIVQSEQKLVMHSLSGVVTAEQYLAYLDGYQVGKEKYCAQSASMLGRIGKPYRGICDDINPFFRSDYNNARREW